MGSQGLKTPRSSHGHTPARTTVVVVALPRWLACAVLLAGVTVGGRAAALPVPEDHECMGRWVGKGRNTGSSTEWTIDLTLTASPSGGRCGTIEYTNPDCGGTLDSCQLVGRDIHTRENYAHSSRSCAPPGRVVIRCEGDHMLYSWIGWEKVDSVLHRPVVAPPTGSPGASSPPPSASPPPAVTDSARPSAEPPLDPTVPSSPAPLPSSPPPPVESAGCGACVLARPRELPALLPGGALLGLALLVRRERRRRT